MSKHSYHIRPAYRREIDIDALARLVLNLALQLTQEDSDNSADDGDGHRAPEGEAA